MARPEAVAGELELPTPTWFIGCGNIGQAILEGWRAAGIDTKAVTVIRPSGTPVEGTRTVATLAEAGPPPRLVVLALKPQQLDDILGEARSRLSAQTVVISLLAGIDAASLRRRFPGVSRTVRAMPNLPVAVRRGVIALYGEDMDEDARTFVGNLIAPLGYAIWAADENRFAAIGAVASSGPAYVARFIAALAKAGEDRGLTAETAATIARETVLGTAWMAAASGEDMSSIARRVASPGGTTQAGLDVLDHDHVLNELIGVVIAAAAQRGRDIAAEVESASLEEAPRLP